MSPSTRPSAGDFTGREKASQQKEQVQATNDRATEMSMASAAQAEEERVGVFDPYTGKLVEDESYGAVLVEEAPTPSGFFKNDEPVLTGHESDEEVAVIVAAEKERPIVPQRERAVSPTVRVRIDQDIEKMTYGMYNNEPNNYSFKEGLQYDIPREVAEHLEERGLIRQWVRG